MAREKPDDGIPSTAQICAVVFAALCLSHLWDGEVLMGLLANFCFFLALRLARTPWPPSLGGQGTLGTFLFCYGIAVIIVGWIRSRRIDEPPSAIELAALVLVGLGAVVWGIQSWKGSKDS